MKLAANSRIGLWVWHHPGGQNWISSFPSRGDWSLATTYSLTALIGFRKYFCTIPEMRKNEAQIPKVQEKMTPPCGGDVNTFCYAFRINRSRHKKGCCNCLGEATISNTIQTRKVLCYFRGGLYPYLSEDRLNWAEFLLHRRDFTSRSQLIHWGNLTCLRSKKAFTKPSTWPSSFRATSGLCSFVIRSTKFYLPYDQVI